MMLRAIDLASFPPPNIVDEEGNAIEFEITFMERSTLPLTEKIIYCIPTILSRCCDKKYLSTFKFPNKDITHVCQQTIHLHEQFFLYEDP